MRVSSATLTAATYKRQNPKMVYSTNMETCFLDSMATLQLPATGLRLPAALHTVR
jgi:hypothetical protein